MDPSKHPDARVPESAVRVWRMTGRRWRGVIRAGMRHRRAERFAVVLRMARFGAGFHDDGSPFDSLRELPDQYQYAPGEPWLDLGGEG